LGLYISTLFLLTYYNLQGIWKHGVNCYQAEAEVDLEVAV